MKHPHIRLTTSLIIGAIIVAGPVLALAQSKADPVIPPTAKGGTIETRAPVPAPRQFDDIKAPPSTPATHPKVPSPPVNVRIRREVSTSDNPAEPRTLPVPVNPSSLPIETEKASIAAWLDSATFAPTIRTTAIAKRDMMMADIESRITGSEKALSTFGKIESEMSAEGRKQFRAASDELKKKAKALRKSVQAARRASEDDWEEARMQLASDYEAYAAALARVDTAANTLDNR